ncbi:MAG TPA: hypothetical protein VJJ82_00600 [Candidatus Nanoarchaeia archaeon]|nr:hypothetical protein [Candidatus Nanoarchaeia archaeon]
MKKQVIEIVGWYGVVAIILAYAGLSFGFLDLSHPAYQLLNLTGSIGILIDALSKKDYEPVVINIFWMVIAVIALVRLIV